MILSADPAVPVKRTTATIVRPPFVAIFKVRAPASRYCDLVRSKVTWPLPCGPPDASYTGRMADPTGALSRVDTDANEGRAATRAKNLAARMQRGDTLTYQYTGPKINRGVILHALSLGLCIPGTTPTTLTYETHTLPTLSGRLTRETLSSDDFHFTECKCSLTGQVDIEG